MAPVWGGGARLRGAYLPVLPEMRRRAVVAVFLDLPAMRRLWGRKFRSCRMKRERHAA
jgi:hypothetical protein